MTTNNINSNYGLSYQGTGRIAGYDSGRRKGFLQESAGDRRDVDTVQGSGAATPVRGSESQLSQKAAAYLADLRKDYGDFDFIVGNAGDDLKALARSSDKEFSVILSSEELEKMASDEAYAKEKLDTLHHAVRMSLQINEQFGFTSAGSSGTDGNADIKMTKFGVAFHDDGSVSYFAELEKSLAKQKERLEKAGEKHAEEKREAARADRDSAPAKRVLVEAPSVEDLAEKIRQIDWSETEAEGQPAAGSRFDSRA